jgi:Cft2 family RNA processing exonuclease
MHNFSIQTIKNLRLIASTKNLSQDQIKLIIDPFKDFDKKNDIIAALKDKYPFKSDNDLYLTIQKILWNELELNDLEWKDNLLHIALIFYLTNKLPMIHILSLFSKMKAFNLFETNFIPFFTYLNVDKDSEISDFEKWLKLIKTESENLGSDIPNLSDCIESYKSLFSDNIPEHWDNIASIIKSIYERKEFSDEILESCSELELLDIMMWIKWSKKKDISKRILKNRLKTVSDFSKTDSIDKAVNPKSQLTNLPLSFSVLDDLVQKLPMTAVTDKMFDNVPQQYISKWAPKFVYSITEPESRPQIQILFPGGKHIGHSGIVIKTRKGSVLLDFGMSVVNNSLPKWLPVLDYVDAVLLSHAHGDHSGGLPLLMKGNPDLPIIAKGETKKLLNSLLHNNSSILSRNYPKSIIKNDPVLKHLIDRKKVNNVLDNIYEIKPKESITLFPDFEVKTWDASHLFGSVGFEINIAGKRLLYTGDFNADGTSIFPGANFPTDVDAFIFDGTYYGRQTPPTNLPTLKTVLKQSKRVLIPAFSLGRSQELLYQLKKMQAYKNWKIIMTGMGGRIASDLNLVSGMGQPTEKSGLHIIPHLTNSEDFTEGTIVIAGQGMLQNGTSRTLLDSTAEDEDTSVVFCGFQAPYSLGYDLQNGNNYLKSKYKQKLFRIKMSGHTSAETLNSILDKTSGEKIIVHAPNDQKLEIKKDDIKSPHELDAFLI